MPDSSSLFSTVSFLPHTLSLAAFWASKGCQGWLPACTPVDKFSLSGAPSPISSPTTECLLEYSLPARRGKRSGRGWGHSCSSPGLHFLPSPGPLGQRKPRQESQSCYQPERHTKLPPTTSQPSCPQRLNIMDLHLAPFLVSGSSAAYVSVRPALPALPYDARKHSPSLTLPAPGTRLHILHHSESPSYCLTSALLAAASALIFFF